MGYKEKYNFESNQINVLFHKFLYYELAYNIMSDYAFDRLCKENQKLGELLKIDSKELTSNIVGFTYETKYWSAVIDKYNIIETDNYVEFFARGKKYKIYRGVEQ